MSVQDALAMAIVMLKDAGVDDPMRDARLLLADCLGIEVGRMTLHLNDILPAEVEADFFGAVSERRHRKPMSHLLGYREFYGRRFAVTPDVLDPRGDTETLIEAALAVPFKEVLDLGTGSGCILVTLLSERGDAIGVAGDLSARAIEIARANAVTHGVEDRCWFEASDWYARVSGTYELIVSNPPYISVDEMAGLAPELAFEPRMALTDEDDGLTAYSVITRGAPANLHAGGWLMVEIGATQGRAVRQMFTRAGLTDVEIKRDLDGRDRVIVGQKPL